MIVTILFRRGFAAEWTLANSLLADGEPGYETDTGLFKIGDGIRRWKQLPYANNSDAQAAVSAVVDSLNDLADLVETNNTTLTNQFSDYQISTDSRFDDISIFQTTTENQLVSLDQSKQNANADLDAIVSLVPSNDDVLQRKSGGWVNRSIAQLKTDLSLTKSDVGLDEADNTSDADKPVSTLQQTALDNRVRHDTPSQGLDATAQSNARQNIGALWIKEAPLTPYQFGSTGPGLAVNNTSPLANMFAAAVTAGTSAEIYFPPGDWVSSGVGGGAFALANSLTIRGAGRMKSRLRIASSAPSMFQWNSDVNGVRIEDLYLDGASSFGHLFEPGSSGGIHASTFKNLFLNQQVDGKAIWYQDNSGSFIHLTFEEIEMQRTAGSNIIPFYVRNSGGGANCNLFKQVRLNGNDNVNTPFMHFESTLSQTFLTDWEFIGIIGEQNRGGVIKMVAPAGVTMTAVTDEDATGAYVADLIRFEANGSGLAPRDITLTGCTRRGSTLNAGVYEIYVGSTGKHITLIGCNPTPTSAYATVFVPSDTRMIQMRLDPTAALTYSSSERSNLGALGVSDVTSQTSISERVQLVQNPISSSVKTVYGWVASRADSAVKAGYIRLTINDATATDMAQRLNSRTTTYQAVEASTLRQFQAKVRTNTGLPCKLTVVFYNSGGTLISSVSSTTVTPDSTNFSLLSVQTTTPSTAAYAYLQVGLSGTGTRSIGQWLDVKEVFAGDPGTYFDGSTGQVDGAISRWSGVLNDSVSYASSVPAPIRMSAGANTLLPSTQGVVDALSGIRIGEERVPITKFGARGDGSTDDTSALLEAVRRTRPTRDSPAAGISGFQLTVPPGEYLLSDTIQFYRWAGLFEGVGVGASPSYVVPGNASVFRWIGANDRPMFKIKDSRHVSIRNMRLEGNDTTPPTYLIECNNLTADNQGHNSNLTFEDLYLGAFTWSSQGSDKGAASVGIGWTGNDGSNDQWYINRCFFRSLSTAGLYLPNIQSIWGSITNSTLWGCGVGIKSVAAFSGYNLGFQGCGKDVELNGSNDKPVHISDWFSEHSGQICHITDRGRMFISSGLWTLHSEMTSNPMLRHDNAINGSGFIVDGVYVSTALATHPKIKMTATNVGTPGRLALREVRLLVDLTTGFDLTTSASSGLDVNLQFGDYNVTGLRLTTGTISSIQPDAIAAFNAALI